MQAHTQAPHRTARPRRAMSRTGGWLVGVVNGDPLAARHALAKDAALAAVLAVSAVVIALLTNPARRPDAVGWALLVALHVPLVWRRRCPLLMMAALLCCVAPYHGLDYNHLAPSGASYVALYTLAATGRPLRTLLAGTCILAVSLSVTLSVDTHRGVELLRISGWVLAFLLIGGYVRVHRQHVAAVVERAERAERTREEEAARRVAEERLRIARDLHDLLAHSITLIGVQASVAAHVLAADPAHHDPAALARALDDISETCRTARGDLRATLQVLRAGAAEPREPLPGLAGLTDLARSARGAGATVRLRVPGGPDDGTPPAVGAAAYRIVQEALTNAVRHAGPEVGVDIDIAIRDGALRVSVTDDGAAAPGAPATPGGFGLVGMRERARSVGGTLHAGPRPVGGFAVTAVLPLNGAVS
ncbi:sensor histidine kinase [Streptomyces sp. NPDC050560]|uniref:sensor histidine kinase n=1 Tax=Streptomyces sp. NPDC050560 TaxID=3365630 RepID=UPI00378E7FAE